MQERAGAPNVQVVWAIPSPDGRSAALDVITGENNVWMIDNFCTQKMTKRERNNLERCFPLTEAAL